MQNEELIYFSCSSCGQDLTATPELYGKTTECPACNAALAIPFPAIMHSGVAKAEASPPPPPQQPQPRHHPSPPTFPSASPPPLWNPDAAACWSWLLSPAFGTYLHAKNAEALGRTDEKRANMKWFYGSLFILALSLVGILVPSISQLSSDSREWRSAMVILLFAWYFLVARKQASFVKQAYGKSYPRRPLGKALLIYCGCAGIFFIVAMRLSSWRDGAGGAGTSSPNRSDERTNQDNDSSLIEDITTTMILKELKSPWI